jgi:alkanesulfonate monooxygenase SsuD/methylene tetrahydromethanopterin reductase-like flavin-dependent oxidoreductase (luciferase family)
MTLRNEVTFGWRMPMWDPAGAKLQSWLPHVREHLDALPRDVFRTVWMSDHLVPGAGWAPPEWDTLECITALIHFATAHPEYRYGQIVIGNSFRPPALLGKMFATLAALTGAPLILGIGAGWMESEYRMYGYPYPPPKQRIEELDDAVQLIRKLWTESPATHQGKHLSIDAAYAEPRPAEPPIVMIGASGEQLALRVVAKHADWWNATTPTAADLAAKRAVLAEHCAKVGRDVDDILVNWQCQCVAIADSEAEAQRLAEASPLHQHGGRGSVIGTPDQVREKLQAMVDVGVRDFILRFADFPRLDGALRFAREIAPGIQARH